MKTPTLLMAGVAAMAIGSQASAADIVDTASSTEGFSTLVTALEAAEMVETLKGDGPFTVFAPTDAAFAKLPEGTVEGLLEPENKEQLQAILAYHVVPGAITSADLSGMTSTAETVQGGEVEIDATGGSVMVGDASVTQADIEASNGVIHVIDSVLMPDS